jgi:hypothetical protein
VVGEQQQRPLAEPHGRDDGAEPVECPDDLAAERVPVEGCRAGGVGDADVEVGEALDDDGLSLRPAG